MELDDSVMLDWASVNAPGVTVIVGRVDVTGTPPMVAVMVRAVPAVVAVNVAVYVPLPLSEKLVNVPLLVPAPGPNTTLAPPVVSRLPLASLAVSVTVVELLDCKLERPTETADCVTLAAPGVTVMVGSAEVTGLPPMVAVMLRAVPAKTPVNVAV